MGRSQVLCEKVGVPVSMKPGVKCGDAGAKFIGFGNCIFSGIKIGELGVVNEAS